MSAVKRGDRVTATGGSLRANPHYRGVVGVVLDVSWGDDMHGKPAREFADVMWASPGARTLAWPVADLRPVPPMIRVWIAGAAAEQMCFERIGDTFTAETGAVTMIATRRRGRGRSVCLEGPRATFRGLAAYAGYTTSGSFSSDCRGHGGTMRRAAAICMAAATGDELDGVAI